MHERHGGAGERLGNCIPLSWICPCCCFQFGTWTGGSGDVSFNATNGSRDGALLEREYPLDTLSPRFKRFSHLFDGIGGSADGFEVTCPYFKTVRG